jgi:hypothetical protein
MRSWRRCFHRAFLEIQPDAYGYGSRIQTHSVNCSGVTVGTAFFIRPRCGIHHDSILCAASALLGIHGHIDGAFIGSNATLYLAGTAKRL